MLEEPARRPLFEPLRFQDHFIETAENAVALDYGARHAGHDPDQVRLPLPAGLDPGFRFYGDRAGRLRRVVADAKPDDALWDFARLRCLLPAGAYTLDPALTGQRHDWALLGWILGSYRFSRYKSGGGGALADPPLLVSGGGRETGAVLDCAEATFFMQNLVNTPACDMYPGALAAEAEALAARHGAQVRTLTGAELIDAGYPLIHAVGRAAGRPPALIDLEWGTASDPQLVLIGKGVCFDAGGLNLKSSDAITLMKKDMAGAAQALALAHLVMRRGLPVRLRVLIPAVENMVAGNALMPGDVVTSRKGVTVEITNTDAEGRLLLADALAAACEQKPDLVVDFATLTGAQRIAFGYDLPSYFCDDDDIAARLERCAREESDPIWRAPLYQPYRDQLESPIADIINRPPTRVAGSILAALLLKEFTDPDVAWIHFDFMGWNMRASAGRAEGGTPQGMRATFAYLRERYGGVG